jgi:antitoxin FitA
MAQLVVRNLPDDFNELNRHAAKHGRSAQQEHREILRVALLVPRHRSSIEALAQITNVGRDGDFERIQGYPRG